MLIVHVISNENDRARTERVTRYMPETFEHQYVTPNELAAYQGGADVLHAHRWFGCGQAARDFAAGNHIPYVADVVQPDLHAYDKLLIFNKKKYEHTLAEASKVVFTTPSQQDDLAKHLPSETADTVFAKSVLLHEPLDSFWLENLHIHQPTALVHIKLLYVGPLTHDSHLEAALHAMKQLHRHNYMVTLTAVEDAVVEGGFRSKMQHEAASNSDFRIVQVENEAALRDMYRSHDILFLPDADSIYRYAEALTQGLAVICGHGSVFDGVFKDGLTGYAINPKSADEVARTILKISDFFATIEQQIMRLHPLDLFNGKELARHYEHLYANLADRR